jgi:AraC-like DNA-binding protein
VTRAQPSSRRRRRDLAEGARAVLAASVEENRSVADIARALDASPFHLCRVFREQTGQTMHAYRVGLRMRRAIERLSVPGGRRSATLSQVANEVGFASHAHFVRICQRELGVTPAKLRDMVRGEWEASYRTLRASCELAAYGPIQLNPRT